MTIYIYYTTLDNILKRSASMGFRRLSLVSRQQIQHFRNQFLSQHDTTLMISTNHYGKPISQNSDLAFNHSHSHQHYALAYSTDVEDIGVDIEDIHRNVRMHALAQDVFHHQEYMMWQKENFSREYWFKVWTTKEAVLKAHGIGILLDLKCLNTQVHPTWDFGFIEHPQLGRFAYHNFAMSRFILTVAYRVEQCLLVDRINIRHFNRCTC